eukprot:TRINITY_DN9424_c0_g7_i1.p1 TRINITY_DN9424_c0_g7~~TRINITY_DN9424_c0_g7_i1.p1  ORF type:complete len:116 (-),score=30.54 TRINITY_DN9424_c0_g7_i1:1365-1712(-)
MAGVFQAKMMEFLIFGSLISVKVDFSHWFHYKVHGGCQISFWHDEWCGQLVLHHQFPNLYLLDGRQQAFVAENVCFVGGGAVWDFSFCQNLMDNEISDFVGLLGLLAKSYLSAER